MRCTKFRQSTKWFGLVLSIVLLCLWLASGWIDKHWSFQSATRTTYIRIEYGRLGFFSFDDSLPDYRYAPGFDLSPVKVTPHWHLNLDFDFHLWLYRDIVVPLWFPLLLVALFTLISFHLERRKRIESICHNCKGDRRDINPGAPCPQCGQPKMNQSRAIWPRRPIAWLLAAIFLAFIGVWTDATVNSHRIWRGFEPNPFSDSIKLQRGSIVIEHLPKTGDAAAYYINSEILQFLSMHVHQPEYFWWPRCVVSSGEWVIMFPLWIPAAITAIPLIYFWRGAPIFRRIRANHCLSCNYDRAGLPSNSPCPECNSTPEPTQPRTRLGDLAPIRLFRKRPAEILLLLALFIWLGSAWYVLGINRGNRVFSICRGSLTTFQSQHQFTGTEFGLDRISNTPHTDVLPHLKSLEWWIFTRNFGSANWELRIPLWPLVLLALLVVAFKWRQDVLSARRTHLRAQSP